MFRLLIPVRHSRWCALQPHIMGNIAVAWFGPIPPIGHQRARKCPRQLSAGCNDAPSALLPPPSRPPCTTTTAPTQLFLLRLNDRDRDNECRGGVTAASGVVIAVWTSACCAWGRGGQPRRWGGEGSNFCARAASITRSASTCRRLSSLPAR